MKWLEIHQSLEHKQAQMKERKLNTRFKESILNHCKRLVYKFLEKEENSYLPSFLSIRILT